MKLDKIAIHATIDHFHHETHHFSVRIDYRYRHCIDSSKYSTPSRRRSNLTIYFCIIHHV
jgi:hypothetical protein